MSPRKHLWSDGWEQEPEQPVVPSAATSPLPAADGSSPSRETETPVPAPRDRRGRRTALAVGAVLVAAAGAWVIVSSATSGGPADRPARARTASPPHADALGLELVGAPGHRVVVQAVVPGSPATAVGIDAGEDLRAVNGHRVTAPGQVDAILNRLALGTPVTLQLTQGPAVITAEIQEPGVP